MTFLRELFRPSLRVVAAALCAAGILHICVTLAAPHLKASPAYRELTEGLELHKMELLPAVTPEHQRLAYMSADARYAVCRFDARNGTVSIEAKLPSPGWVLSVYVPSGDNVYSAVAPPGRTLDVLLRIVPSDDPYVSPLFEKGAPGGSGNAWQSLSAEEGVVLIRAPDQGAAYRDRNLSELSRAACTYRPRGKARS